MYEHRASRDVYAAMCEFFGTSKDVALRRDVMDINEMHMSSTKTRNTGIFKILVGAHGKVSI